MIINFNRITMIRKYIMIASALLCGSIFTACDDDNDTPDFPEKTETTYDMSGFAGELMSVGCRKWKVPDINSIPPMEKNRNVCLCFATWV